MLQPTHHLAVQRAASVLFCLFKGMKHFRVHSKNPGKVLQTTPKLVITKVDPRKGGHSCSSTRRGSLHFFHAWQEGHLQHLKIYSSIFEGDSPHNHLMNHKDFNSLSNTWDTFICVVIKCQVYSLTSTYYSTQRLGLMKQAFDSNI